MRGNTATKGIAPGCAIVDVILHLQGTSNGLQKKDKIYNTYMARRTFPNKQIAVPLVVVLVPWPCIILPNFGALLLRGNATVVGRLPLDR